jgi:hypothetical protein
VASFTLRSLYRADRAAGAEWLGSRLGPVVGLDSVTTLTELSRILAEKEEMAKFFK